MESSYIHSETQILPAVLVRCQGWLILAKKKLCMLIGVRYSLKHLKIHFSSQLMILSALFKLFSYQIGKYL